MASLDLSLMLAFIKLDILTSDLGVGVICAWTIIMKMKQINLC